MQLLKGMETLFVYWDGTISRIFYPEKKMQSIWYDLLLFFFGCTSEALGILVPWAGIQPMPPAMESQSLNHWTTRKVLW